jgi:hypothetical protein
MSVLVIARAQPLLDRIVPLLRAGGIAATGTTSDEDAMSMLATGGVAALVIGGGVEEASRLRLEAAARRHGIRVLAGAARGKDPGVYVKDELLPALRS